MRIALVTAFLLAAVAQAQAQSPKERKEAKLKEEWLKNADWGTDYDEAVKKAGESGKLIFAYFTRSYSP